MDLLAEYSENMINIDDAGADPQMREAPLYTAGGATASARQFARKDRVGKNVFFLRLCLQNPNVDSFSLKLNKSLCGKIDKKKL